MHRRTIRSCKRSAIGIFMKSTPLTRAKCGVLQEKRKIVAIECVTYEKVYKGESPSLVMPIEWQLVD
jgi:hypothetical protein